MLQWSYTTILWCISVEQMKVGGVRDSLIKFMLNPPASQLGCDDGIWTKKTAAVSQLGCDDGNISVFLGQSSVLLLRHYSRRMIQMNLIRDLLYSSINGGKDLGLRRNYEDTQYEEQMKL